MFRRVSPGSLLFDDRPTLIILGLSSLFRRNSKIMGKPAVFALTGIPLADATISSAQCRLGAIGDL